MLLFARKQLTAGKILKSKAIVVYLAVCIFTGLLASLFNTFALYVDSKMFGYYSVYMVFGVLLVRLSIAAVMSFVFGFVALNIVSALQRNKII